MRFLPVSLISHAFDRLLLRRNGMPLLLVHTWYLVRTKYIPGTCVSRILSILVVTPIVVGVVRIQSLIEGYEDDISAFQLRYRFLEILRIKL